MKIKPQDLILPLPMLTEAVNELLVGDLEAGKAMLRDYVKPFLD